ncbi:MAG: hypothetical protein ACRCZO_00905 [Cetobacterium sp.]
MNPLLLEERLTETHYCNTNQWVKFEKFNNKVQKYIKKRKNNEKGIEIINIVQQVNISLNI